MTNTQPIAASPGIPLAGLRHLLLFMQLRQQIYLDRQAGRPFPWTTDPILRDYRLENVYREQDKETVYLRRNWLHPYANHQNLWFAACLFRLINWSPTLADIGFPETWNPRQVLEILERRMAAGEKTYTSVYRIQHHGCASNALYLVHRVLEPLWKAVSSGTNPPIWDGGKRVSLEAAHGWLSQFFGFGDDPGFTNYEVITDLRHTRYLCNAPDIMTWANAGPGARDGIRRLLGVGMKTKIPVRDQLRYMREAFRWLDQNRDRRILPTLEMRDVEHSLCCYHKWRRAHGLLQAGKPVKLERFHPPRKNLLGDRLPPPRRLKSRVKAVAYGGKLGLFPS